MRDLVPDDDYADEEWVEDDGDDADDLLACPHCRQEVHEDTQQCPFCGDWIVPVSVAGARQRTIWLVAVVLLIVSFVLITLL